MSAQSARRSRAVLSLPMRCALMLSVLTLGACAPTSSRALRPTLAAREIASRIAQSASSSQAQSPLLLATRDRELLAYDLAQAKLRFSVPIERGAQAELLGDVIWVHAGRQIIALDAQRGAELYRFEQAGRYAGAARAAERIAFGQVTGAELDPTASSLIKVVDARTGTLAYERRLVGYAAAPIAAQAFWLIPLQRQRLVVLDVASGDELTRLRAESDAIDWVVAERSAVLFGGTRMHRLTAAAEQPKSALTLPAALRELPGRPEAPRSAYANPGTAASLRRVGLHVTPVPEGSDGIALLQDRVYFVFYGHVLGFDGRAQLVLARRLDADVLDARVLAQGLLVVTASGEAQLLSHASGETLAARALGAPIRSAQLPTALDALKVVAPVAAAPSTAASSSASSSAALQAGLLAIAQDADARLVPSRVLAVRELARLHDADITRDLLELYERPSTPPELQRALADGIATRRSGLTHLVSALQRRYGFLEQTRPAPLTVIAPVLAAAGERSALPGLIERLRDHETPTTALASLANAIGVLGDAETGASLLAWLRLYRNDSSLRDAPDALAAVARAAIALRGEQGRSALRAMLAEGRASKQVEQTIAPLLAPSEQVTQVTTATSAVAQATPAKRALPRSLSQRDIDTAFAARERELRPCIDGELQRNPTLGQIRITFVAEGDGSAHAFHFAPATTQLVDCLYPLVASLRLPAFSQDRAVARVAIDAHPATDATAPSPEPSASAAQPWWTWRVRGARSEGEVEPPRRQKTPRGEREGAQAAPVPWWRTQQGFAQRIEQAPAPAAPAPTPSAPTAPAPTKAPPATHAATKPPPPVTPAAAPPPTPTAPPATPAPDRWWLPTTPAGEAPKPGAPSGSR